MNPQGDINDLPPELQTVFMEMLSPADIISLATLARNHNTAVTARRRLAAMHAASLSGQTLTNQLIAEYHALLYDY
ncbi:hypothetical protein [Actinokineospora sp. HUAS TT18]|uniref:hypothetical protein n=1 Tax=Actinokineospora sp. HUAS TT18 TaxID=3447451 RepID=UPI003F51C5F0